MWKPCKWLVSVFQNLTLPSFISFGGLFVVVLTKKLKEQGSSLFNLVLTEMLKADDAFLMFSAGITNRFILTILEHYEITGKSVFQQKKAVQITSSLKLLLETVRTW